MAGGVGSRFWPMSTAEKPKQFIDVLGTGRSLLQLTFDRFKGVCSPENVWVVTSVNYKDVVKEQLPEIPETNILCEPCRRNTAPCIAYVSWRIKAKDRTLGADDKAGVANALYFAKYLKDRKDLKHGGLEIHFTRDEENGMSGIKNTDFSRINSKYVLVLDSDALGQCLISGASYVMVDLKISAPKGGHSGNDIGDSTRENAAKLIADLVSEMPQGVFYREGDKVVTSCNIGGITAGDLNVTNVINTDAHATYSIRSSRKDKENELIEMMQTTVNNFNKEYPNIATATITFTEKMPMFEKNEDNTIPELFEKTAKQLGITPEISSFHAGAETHIYANKTNAKGEKFSPYLLGLATVCNMHSAREYVDYKTMIKGQELLQAFFEAFNK